jgi:ABC-type Co2+ transport system permease subunit
MNVIIYIIIVLLLAYSVYRYNEDNKLDYISLIAVACLFVVLGFLNTGVKRSISIADVNKMIKNVQS